MMESLQSSAVTIEHVHDIGARGATVEIAPLLARIPASRRLADPSAMALRALKNIAEADVTAGLGLLRRAIDHAQAAAVPYLVDLYVPILLTRGEIDAAADVLDKVSDVDEGLRAAFLASRAQLRACQGRDEESQAASRDALELCRASDDALGTARVLQRTAVAAYYREDFGEAQENALEAARLFEKLQCNRHAAASYSVLYIIASDWSGNLDVARFYAQRMVMQARLAGDLAIEYFGLVAQLEIAAESGDEKRLASLRARLLAGAYHEQYRERFAFSLSEVLASGWSGRFDTARAELLSVRQGEKRSQSEKALCDALLAIVCLSNWQIEEAKRYARLAISETAHRGDHEPVFDARRRRVARVLAAAACVVMGDPSRGRRALSRQFDPDQEFAALLSIQGVDEERMPPHMRGYAKFLNAACALSKRRRPQLGLTSAEMAVLRALPDGLTLASLAASFGKSPKTIEAQVTSIYAKLNVSNRAQAIQRARELGIYA